MSFSISESTHRLTEKLTARTARMLQIVWESRALPEAWREDFEDYAVESSCSKLAMYCAAIFGVQILTIIWYIERAAVGAISTGDLVFRLILNAAYLAGLALISHFAAKPAGTLASSETGVVWFVIVLVGGQILSAVMDGNDTIVVYRLCVMAVIVAMLSDVRPRWVRTITGATYFVTLAALVALTSWEGLAAHLPAVAACVLGTEFMCFFVRAGNVTTYINQRMTRESAEHLESANNKLRAANDRLERVSTTDQLTQVANRRHFDEYIDRMWQECRRLMKPITILMMDIDHFKKFNDYFGHVDGDDCLKTVAGAAKRHFNRSVDLFARYGGEEFVAVLPFTEGKNALHLAEAVRADVEELAISNPQSSVGPHVTLSIGVACMVPDSRNSGYLLNLADEALYRAKSGGRNRVEHNFTGVSDAQAEEAAHHADTHEEFAGLRGVLRGLSGAVFLLDLKKGSLEFSKEYSLFTGMEHCIFDPYTRFADRLHPEDHNLLQNMITAIRDGADFRDEQPMRLKHLDGRYIDVLMGMRRIFTRDLSEGWAFGIIRAKEPLDPDAGIEDGAPGESNADAQ